MTMGCRLDTPALNVFAIALVTGLSPHITGFKPLPVHMRYVVDKGTLGHVLLQAFQFIISVSFH